MYKNKKWLLRRIKNYVFLLGCILTQHISAYEYTITADKWMTSRAGADLSYSLMGLYSSIENLLLRSGDTNVLGYLLKIPLRYIVATEIMVIQHEVFGHGSRARELDVGVEKYEIGFLQGATQYDLFSFITLPLQKRAVLSLGGISGTHVLAERIKRSFFAEGDVIDPVKGIGYIVNQIDQIIYSFSDYKGSGHDIKHYMDYMNAIYGANFLTKEKIKTAAIISAIDPFLLFSLYSFVVDQDVNIPMFTIGEVGYLPALRSIYTPYGIETKLLNHFTAGNLYGQVNLSYGKNKTGKSYSLETNLYNLWVVNSLAFSVELAIWNQPELFLVNPLQAGNKLGGVFNLISEYQFTKRVAGMVALGYKTQGYKPGLPPMQTPLVRVGLAVSI